MKPAAGETVTASVLYSKLPTLNCQNRAKNMLDWQRVGSGSYLLEESEEWLEEGHNCCSQGVTHGAGVAVTC